uniref:ATP synthase complex subunit 8 n=2 Tax=Hiodon TaxID=54903 RepID=E6N1D5_9TELE|nr:ATP synthase F0 subunit 8 [Hiodon alosoides]YP_004221893.1 ATP synthase F0 subunit 8 [Hiodon tergisus]BAC24001.1 ATPase subunits 8 [Hiodon alosoides]BAJ54211.1 ATPase subunits 8 [Hiodon tergisus]
MPQLNPAPWFLILLFSWLVFLTIIPTKIMGHSFTNEPTTRTAKETHLTSWTWPWH